MSDFEIILDHLGPSAAPLMSFLYRIEAAKLLLTNKNVAEKVSAHAGRWGFQPAPYEEHADGRFTLTTSQGSKTFPPLRPWQRLGYRKLSDRERMRNPLIGYKLVVAGDYNGPKHLMHVSIADRKTICRESKPYIEARNLKLKKEEQERRLAEAEAKAAAEKAAFLAKYSVKINNLGPPTYPWAKKPLTVAKFNE